MSEVKTRRKQLTTRAEVNRARGDIADRIDEIINEVNQTNPAGRSQNYLGGAGDQDIADGNGVIRHIRAAQGHPLIEQRMMASGGSTCIPQGGSLPKGRKKRSDAGVKRQPSEWIKFVKAVQAAKGVPYKEAMSIASNMKKEGYTIADL